MVRSNRPGLGAIFLTIFLDLLGFGLVIPFLAEEARDNFHTTAFVGSLLGAVYSLMQFLFVPVWGRVSDRIGRRPVLVWSIGAGAVSMASLGFGIAFGTSVLWLFAARAFSGIATANLGTASAYIADVTKPEERARGMAVIGMAFGLGFILGPGMGGLLAKITVNGHMGPVACFAAAGLGLVNFIWVAYGLPESLPPERRATQPIRSLSPLNIEAAQQAFSRPGVARAVATNFLIIVSFTNLDQTFRYFNKDVFGMDQVATGVLLAVIGLTAAAVQGGLIRPLTKRYDEAPIIRSGVLIQAIAFAGIASSPWAGKWLLFAASMLLAVGNGLTQPTVSAFISKRADPREQGATLGTSQSMASLARVIGPGFGGFVYGAIGPSAPYLAGAIGMVIALAIAVGLEEPRPVPTATTT